MRIALFEPDIPQNAGNIFRLGACLGIPIDIIEPAGFVIDDKRLKSLLTVTICQNLIFHILHTWRVLN